MKEIFDAVNNRIKTPYFGYSVLAFIAFNWRGFFFLVTSSGTPEERLALFDAEVDVWTLFIYPLIVGLFVASSAHWIRYVFALIERKPRWLVNSLMLDEDHQKNIKQAELEQLRGTLFALKENELIGRAKRDELVADIEDEATKEKLADQLSKLREERDRLSNELSGQLGATKNISSIAEEILLAAASDKDGTIMKSVTLDGSEIYSGKKTFGSKNKREFAKYEQALDDLLDVGFVKNVGNKGEIFELTNAGWEYAEST